MPQSNDRIDRVGDLIRQDIAMILQREIQNPKLKMITISKVIVTRDLKTAKILVSFLNDDEQHIKDVMTQLNKAAPYIRRKLAKQWVMRSVPELAFRHDEQLVKAERLSRLIDEANRSDKVTIIGQERLQSE